MLNSPQAENRQIAATGSNLSMAYSYDGNGERVRAYNAITDQTTYFIYDGNGELAAEYTVNVPPPTLPWISYLTNDALGSPRVITNSYGDLKARRDFYPFGEEIGAGVGSRNINQRYSATADDTRIKFATYQRDIETGLDFAQSRYFSPKLGRFTSPDEFKGGPDELFDFEEDARSNPTFYADLSNPQSLNKYQYGYNNPYKFNDPTGHCPKCWILAEIALTVWDVVETGRTFRDPNASISEKTAALAGTVIGVMAPGGGYGVAGKYAVKALKREAVEVVTKAAVSAPRITATTNVAAKKTFQTYTKTHPVTKKVYSGKTSGTGTPQQNIARRDRSHHKNKDGYGPAKLDKSSDNPDAIRGREQQNIDSDRQANRSGNIRNSVSPRNPNREKYRIAAEKEFGKPK